MSCSYYAHIIAGIPATRKAIEQTVTRYNEKTGAPYQKVEKIKQWKTSDNIDIPECCFYEDDETPEINGEPLILHGEGDKQILGVIAQTARENKSQSLNLKEAQATLDELNEWLKNELHTSVEATLMLWLEVNC